MNELAVPTKRTTVSLIKVKSCTALLCMLLVCIRSYLKSALGYECSILVTYHPDTRYLREQGCEDPWLFFEAKRGPRAKEYGEHCTRPPIFREKKIKLFTPCILTQ
jgi:hypothetical protein